MCLAQLNRQAEATRDNRPRMSHLRESGCHRAGRRRGDVRAPRGILSLAGREEKERQDGNHAGCWEAELIISKQRNGPTGDIKLHWKHEFTRFESATQRPYDEFEQFGEAPEPF